MLSAMMEEPTFSMPTDTCQQSIFLIEQNRMQLLEPEMSGNGLNTIGTVFTTAANKENMK